MAEKQQTEQSRNEGNEQFPSKIPRFTKSKIPVYSAAYKNKIKEQKLKIEEGRKKVVLMKEEMHECRRRVLSERSGISLRETTITSGASTSTRNIIYTPGGTRRKGII